MGSVVAQPPPRATPQPAPSLQDGDGNNIDPEGAEGCGGVPSSSPPGQRFRPPWGPECLAILFVFECIPGRAGRRNTEVLVHVISSLTRPTRTATCLPGRGRGRLALPGRRRPCMSVGPCPCLSLNLAVPWTQELAVSSHREQRRGRRAWSGA